MGGEDHFTVREIAKHEGCQETILTEQQKVLLVQSIDRVLRVFLDDFRLGDDGHPVTVALACLETIHTETARQTGHTTKDRLEAFGQMMRDKVLVHLDSTDPRSSLVCNLCLSAESHDKIVVNHAVDQQSQRGCINFGIGIHLSKRKKRINHRV